MRTDFIQNIFYVWPFYFCIVLLCGFSCLQNLWRCRRTPSWLWCFCLRWTTLSLWWPSASWTRLWTQTSTWSVRSTPTLWPPAATGTSLLDVFPSSYGSTTSSSDACRCWSGPNTLLLTAPVSSCFSFTFLVVSRFVCFCIFLFWCLGAALIKHWPWNGPVSTLTHADVTASEPTQKHQQPINHQSLNLFNIVFIYL